MECGIERAFLDPKLVVGCFVDAEGNAVTVERTAAREDLEHEQGQRALKGFMPRHAQESY
jgi:hypothetical protein